MAGGYALSAGLFIAGWTLMIVAMMMPTSAPLVLVFRTLIRRRANQVRLTALLLVGYLAVWTAFGGVAYLGDGLVHGFVDADPWLRANAWLLGVLPLAGAGVYQFTPLKYACLDKCRSRVPGVVLRNPVK
jgi:predicted metal-binding membrane protein